MIKSEKEEFNLHEHLLKKMKDSIEDDHRHQVHRLYLVFLLTIKEKFF